MRIKRELAPQAIRQGASKAKPLLFTLRCKVACWANRPKGIDLSHRQRNSTLASGGPPPSHEPQQPTLTDGTCSRPSRLLSIWNAQPSLSGLLLSANRVSLIHSTTGSTRTRKSLAASHRETPRRLEGCLLAQKAFQACACGTGSPAPPSVSGAIQHPASCASIVCALWRPSRPRTCVPITHACINVPAPLPCVCM